MMAHVGDTEGVGVDVGRGVEVGIACVAVTCGVRDASSVGRAVAAGDVVVAVGSRTGVEVTLVVAAGLSAAGTAVEGVLPSW